jgi:hypothetical protein
MDQNAFQGIGGPTLRAYAAHLFDNGFTIYEPISEYRYMEYFLYSRKVDGHEYFGQVERAPIDVDTFSGYTHSMPIRPTRKYGSYLYMPFNGEDELTVEAAQKVASPMNSNRFIGAHHNHMHDVEAVKRRYRAIVPASTIHDTGVVEVLRPDAYEPSDAVVTCGVCARSWDDTIVTALTPVPGARCPFEYGHEDRA